jgi:putative transposase
MIDHDHELSVTRQAEVVGIARSTVHYLPRPVSAADLDLMKRIDRLHAEFARHRGADVAGSIGCR